MTVKKAKTHRSATRRSAPWALLLVIVGVVASSCTSSSSPSTSTTPSKTVTNVTIGIPLKNIAALPIFVAQTNGYFAAHGLKVQSPILSATTTTTALLGNSVQFISDNASTFLSARAQSSPITAISQWDNGQPVAMLISTAFAKAHHITASTPLATIMKAIPGSTGGSSSPTTTGQAYVLFNSYGVKQSQVKVASFSTVGAVETAIEKSSVDWMVTAEPTPLELQSKGFGLVVASASNAKAWQALTLNQMLVTSNSYAKSNPATVKAFTAAINEATKFINGNTDKAATIAMANLPGISRSIMEKSIASLKWPTTGNMTTSIWNTTIKFNESAGIVPSGTKVVEGTDWTNQYVKS